MVLWAGPAERAAATCGMYVLPMRRLSAALGVAVIVATLAAQPMAAAMEIAVSVSPAQGLVGRPIEVLVRTFIPIGADLAVPAPSFTYPAQSGLWNVLYPVADYPFDVVARSPAGETVQIELVRDPTDGTLWRGSFTPTSAGEWSIEMRNFPTLEPIRVTVSALAADSGSWVGVAVALVIGLIGGLVLGRMLRRPGSRTMGDSAAVDG